MKILWMKLWYIYFRYSWHRGCGSFTSKEPYYTSKETTIIFSLLVFQTTQWQRSKKDDLEEHRVRHQNPHGSPFWNNDLVCLIGLSFSWIMHKDLKLKNLLFDTVEEDDTLKIIDLIWCFCILYNINCITHRLKLFCLWRWTHLFENLRWFCNTNQIIY